MKNISNPAILRTLVQDGVKCETCKGAGGTCPDCIAGHTPLLNVDFDALAAKWCRRDSGQWYHPTTDPVAAMQLQMEYKLQPKIIELQGKEYWYVPCGTGSDDCSVVEGITVESLCQALTEAALIAALTEAIKGGL